MRAVVQRVKRAEVRVDDRVISQIGTGLCILLGVGPDDNAETARHLARRVASLRIFNDDAQKMNLDVLTVGGEALVVSPFTLHADSSRGHRPSFIGAAPPEIARGLCDSFAATLSQLGVRTSSGQFGAQMVVSLDNEGPVTIVLSHGEEAWAADAG